MEAAPFIGLWGLTSAITIILAHYSSEVYRAKGRPKLSVLVQFLHIIVLWPTTLLAVKYGFEVLYIARSLVRLELVLVNMIVMYFVVRIPFVDMMKNVSHSLVATIIMASISYALQSINSAIWWQIMSILISICIYFSVIMLYANERKLLVPFIMKIKSKI